MRKSVAALTAGALIIGGAAVASAQTDDTAPAENSPAVQLHERRAEHISDFFADMVGEGVISQDQADQMTAELENRAEARIAEREERKAAFEAAWEDDVLTLAEIEELGADRFLAEDGPFAEALADGELTRDEVETVRGEFGGPRGHRGGPGGFGGASPAESDTSLDA